MLRRFFIAMMALLYLTTTSGVVMNIHYCMGKIASLSLTHDAASKAGSCGKCGMDQEAHGCCADETVFHKVTEEHQVTAVSTLHPVEPASVSLPITSFFISWQGCGAAPLLDYHAPPPQLYNKLYRSVSVFRI